MQRIEDRYYVFGGYSHLGALNDLYILDYKQLRWQKMDSEGVLPNKRENMGSSVYGKTFYIAGGCDPNHYICYEDTHKFNTTTSEWSLLDESSLEPKGDFAMEIQEGIMYSFGGAFFLESVYNSIKSQDTEDPCPEQCSGNGTCVNDVCECDGGWTGDACDQEAHCEYDCFDRGLCYDQVCECFPGYSGPHCSEVVYCPFNCTSTDNGVCQDNGECDCSGDWTGEDCNQLTPQAQCRENCKHGDCDTEGKCVCWAGYIGSNCDLHMPETATQTESKHEAPKEESTVRHRSDGGQKTVEPEPEQDETAGPTLSTDAKMSFGEAQEYNHALTPEMFGLSFPVVDDEPADNLRTDLDLPDDKDMSEEQEASEDKLEDMDAMLQECELMCSHHGLCIDSTCYCEEGYTGEICEKKESELSEGHPMSLAMMLGGIGFALSFIVGFWITRNLSKAIAAREQAQVEAEDSDD